MDVDPINQYQNIINRLSSVDAHNRHVDTTFFFYKNIKDYNKYKKQLSISFL